MPFDLRAEKHGRRALGLRVRQRSLINVVAGLVSICGRDEDPGVNEHLGSDAFGELLGGELDAFVMNV